MKTTSRFALAAAAGLFVGAMAFTPAKAADLGGDCCADLEERVAELEATTARKGNRVVSLEVSGRVNRALLFWDDGVDSDVYIVDNDHSSSRLGFAGSGSLKPGWTAGYDVVFNVQEADSFQVSQTEADTNDSGQPVAFDIRRARVYLQSDQLGRLTIGQGQAATDGIAEVDLAYGNYSNDNLYIAGFDIIGGGGLTFGDLGFNLDGAGRTNNIRYDSPSLFGFILSASFGENDYADVALRFSREWNSIQFAAAAGYVWESTPGRLGADDGPDSETFATSASVQHTPSGLFLTGAYGMRETDDENVTITGCDPTAQAFDGACLDLGLTVGGVGTFPLGFLEDADEDLVGTLNANTNREDDEFFSVKGGIEKDFTGLGATTIFGMYKYHEDFATGEILGTTFTEFAAAGPGNAPVADYVGDLVGVSTFVDAFQVTDTEMDVYAFGVNQNFASAATDIYAHFEYTETDIQGQEIDGVNGGAGNAVCPAGQATCSLDTEDFWAVVVGSRVRF